ncbi:Lon protease family protein [Gemmatimonadota bacterium]
MPDRPVALTPDRLRSHCDPAVFPTETTAEMESEIVMIGQPRAARSIEFALGVSADGYNLFMAGEPGTGRKTSIKIALGRTAAERPTPEDWCYVHNFAQPDSPGALRLPAGMGCEFKKAVADLVEELKDGIPKAFEGPVYEERRAHLVKDLSEKRDELFNAFKTEAEDRGFTVEQSGGGIMTLPVKDGKPMSSQEWEDLSEEDRTDLEQKQEDLQKVMRDITRQVRDLEKSAKLKLRDLERIIAAMPVAHAIDEVKEAFEKYKPVIDYLEGLKEDVLTHLEDFKDEEEEQQMPFPGMKAPREVDVLLRYGVNVLVDNCEQEGAPVIWESNPSFYNLVGRMEYRASMGTMTTDFTMIKGGALHQANGGYLVVQALDVLRNQGAWEALKRALQTHEIHLEDLNDQFRMVQTQGLKPEPIPIDVKVIMIGSPMLGMLLYDQEEDFSKLFKVKADFGLVMEQDDKTVQAYAGFITSIAREENLLPFHRSAMARIVEHGGRIVADQGKLSTRFVEIADLLREADYWAQQSGSDIVTSEHVVQAIGEKVYRSNRIEERLQEMITEGTVMVDTEGSMEGQINGLAVLGFGDYDFGKPSRLTARVYAGKAGIIQIDRDTELAGNLHNKGVLILQGFFASRYASKTPLSFSASLTFEQLYSGVDGDSASSTELYCLLSALAEVPLRQDLAVTGSVNQLGEVQAIGGVNQKIEGWYHTCKLKGLTGTQGVMIPASNVRNLQLKDEVIEAVEAGQFSIYPIEHVDQGIELLTGIEAGEQLEDGTWTEGSINNLVAEHLESLFRSMQEASGNGNGKGILSDI